MPTISPRTHFRQRPTASEGRERSARHLKGCLPWVLPLHPSDLEHSSCEGASKDLSSGIAKKREREEDPTILLMMGRDDYLLSAYLDLSAESSAVDSPSWRSGAPPGPLFLHYDAAEGCSRSVI